MAEYTIRKADKKRIEIGEAEEMCYLRFRDLDQVQRYTESYIDLQHDDNLVFRLPLPGEDNLLPGDYCTKTPFLFHHQENREYCRLKKEEGMFEHCCAMPDKKPLLYSTVKGIYLFVECEHNFASLKQQGVMMEDIYIEDENTNFFCLSGVRTGQKELMICVSCFVCELTWLYKFSQIERLICNPEMKKRLFWDCLVYWRKKNRSLFPYYLTGNGNNNCIVYLCESLGEKFRVCFDCKQGPHEIGQYDTFEEAYQVFIKYVI